MHCILKKTIPFVKKIFECIKSTTVCLQKEGMPEILPPQNSMGLFETYGGSYQPSTRISPNLNVENFLPVLIANHFALPDKI
jgi:hypothetical protein